MSSHGNVFLGGFSAIAATVFSASSAMAAGGPVICKFFCFHGAPAPVVGAGLPMLAAAGVAILLVRRFQRKAR